MGRQNSPLHASRIWSKYCDSAEGVFELNRILAGLPNSWLVWADRIAEASELRGRHIHDPLNYRLSILWNGVTLLQETKFICDVLENSFRNLIEVHFANHRVKICEVNNLIPDWNRTFEAYKEEVGSFIENEDSFPDDILIQLSFYQTTELMARNWKNIKLAKERKDGFREIFRTSKYCRDLNLFNRDMKSIRHARNRIAHSKKLFELREAQSIYDLSDKWLSHIEINIGSRIENYRKNRPRFLEHISLPDT